MNALKYQGKGSSDELQRHHPHDQHRHDAEKPIHQHGSDREADVAVQVRELGAAHHVGTHAAGQHESCQSGGEDHRDRGVQLQPHFEFASHRHQPQGIEYPDAQQTQQRNPHRQQLNLCQRCTEAFLLDLGKHQRQQHERYRNAQAPLEVGVHGMVRSTSLPKARTWGRLISVKGPNCPEFR